MLLEWYPGQTCDVPGAHEQRLGIARAITRFACHRLKALEFLGGLRGRFFSEVGGGCSVQGSKLSQGHAELMETLVQRDAPVDDAQPDVPLSDAVHGRGFRPRVLLTTLSGEGRGLGILMAEAMFTLSMRMYFTGLADAAARYCRRGGGAGGPYRRAVIHHVAARAVGV